VDAPAAWTALLRWIRGSRRAPPAREQLRRILSVPQRAVDLEPAAQRTVRACGSPGEVPGQVGADCGELITAYLRLRAELRDVPVDPQRQDLKEETEHLLHYHQWLLRTALELAFSISANPRREGMRRRLHGLGAPATRLAEVRQQVADELNTRYSGT
jgi:hypothetical protein